MIRFDHPQGSPEWKAARLGVVTASGLDKILTAKGLKPSAQADGYMHRLIAETILGVPLDDQSIGFMERGIEMEGEAARWYAFDRGVSLETVGFLARDDGRVGCSPDRLVGDDGGLEIKVPAAQTHVGYLLNPDTLAAEYRGQVQCGLWISGRKWWDLLSYSPAFPQVVVRVAPDPVYLAALAPAVDAFLTRMDAALATIRPLVEARMVENPLL